MIPQKLPFHQKDIYTIEMMFNKNIKFDYVRGFVHSKIQKFPIGMHKHNFYEINIIKNGTGYHYIKDTRIEAKKGDVFIILPNVMHGYYTEEPSTFEIINVLIHSYYINRYESELSSLNGFRLLFEIEPAIREKASEKLFLRLAENNYQTVKPFLDILIDEKVNNTNDAINKIGALTSLISILSEIYQKETKFKMKNKPSKKTNSMYIIETMNYMLSNYNKKITIPFLAQLANMSISSYTRHFNKINKITPMEYLTNIRIDASKKMLSRTTLSIIDVANECGFFDSSHFLKTFKNKVGITPLKYRRERSK